MTAATPITIPNTVSKDRSLLDKSPLYPDMKPDNRSPIRLFFLLILSDVLTFILTFSL